jgi:hypothetical protein
LVVVVVVLVLFELELSPLAGCVTVVVFVVDVVLHGCHATSPATMATIATTKIVIAVRFDPEPSLTTMLRSSFMQAVFPTAGKIKRVVPRFDIRRFG